ncbi:MAG: hypothetical protein AAF788_03735 [Pseudomonadota bacterium]
MGKRSASYKVVCGVNDGKGRTVSVMLGRSEWVFPARSRSGHVASFKRKGGLWLRPHMCRHTYRSFCAMAGVPLEICMALMNHKGQGVTFRYVTRAALEDTMREHAERVAERMLAYRTAPSPSCMVKSG